MFGIWQAGEWQGLLLPVFGNPPGIFWANYNDLGISDSELGIVLAQLRHVRAAVRSSKGAVENQQDIFLTAQIR